MIRALNVKAVVNSVPQLKRGQVWCRTCGFTMPVDSGRCLSSGWPKCCGHTMTIDAPKEREQADAKTEQ